MTVLSSAQEAAIELNQAELTTLFASTERFAKELQVQAKRSARAIAKAHDWNILTTRATITGDGTTTAFDLPDDYDRMILKTKLTGEDSNLDLVKVEDLDQWDYFQNHPGTTVPGYWIVLGGQLQVFPAPATGVTYSYYYITKDRVTSSGGVKEDFEADADEFLLPEDLLTLSLIWRWRASKRQEYAEDLRNFEILLAQEIMADKGTRILTVGRQRISADVRTAYPRPLGS